jgi:hypothetical protein
VPFYFRLAATFALAPVHAGVWLWEELSQDYCRRCRRWLSFLSVVMAAFTLTGAFFAFRWVYRQKFF